MTDPVCNFLKLGQVTFDAFLGPIALQRKACCLISIRASFDVKRMLAARRNYVKPGGLVCFLITKFKILFDRGWSSDVPHLSPSWGREETEVERSLKQLESYAFSIVYSYVSKRIWFLIFGHCAETALSSSPPSTHRIHLLVGVVENGDERSGQKYSACSVV